jgi:hypothetical protein
MADQSVEVRVSSGASPLKPNGAAIDAFENRFEMLL